MVTYFKDNLGIQIPASALNQVRGSGKFNAGKLADIFVQAHFFKEERFLKNQEKATDSLQNLGSNYIKELLGGKSFEFKTGPFEKWIDTLKYLQRDDILNGYSMGNYRGILPVVYKEDGMYYVVESTNGAGDEGTATRKEIDMFAELDRIIQMVDSKSHLGDGTNEIIELWDKLDHFGLTYDEREEALTIVNQKGTYKNRGVVVNKHVFTQDRTDRFNHQSKIDDLVIVDFAKVEQREKDGVSTRKLARAGRRYAAEEMAIGGEEEEQDDDDEDDDDLTVIDDDDDGRGGGSGDDVGEFEIHEDGTLSGGGGESKVEETGLDEIVPPIIPPPPPPINSLIQPPTKQQNGGTFPAVSMDIQSKQQIVDEDNEELKKDSIADISKYGHQVAIQLVAKSRGKDFTYYKKLLRKRNVVSQDKYLRKKYTDICLLEYSTLINVSQLFSDYDYEECLEIETLKYIFQQNVRFDNHAKRSLIHLNNKMNSNTMNSNIQGMSKAYIVETDFNLPPQDLLKSSPNQPENTSSTTKRTDEFSKPAEGYTKPNRKPVNKKRKPKKKRQSKPKEYSVGQETELVPIKMDRIGHIDGDALFVNLGKYDTDPYFEQGSLPIIKFR